MSWVILTRSCILIVFIYILTHFRWRYEDYEDESCVRNSQNQSACVCGSLLVNIHLLHPRSFSLIILSTAENSPGNQQHLYFVLQQRCRERYFTVRRKFFLWSSLWIFLWRGFHWKLCAQLNIPLSVMHFPLQTCWQFDMSAFMF